MELVTVDNQFFEKDQIDFFESAIWTDRYKGDGDFKIIVPDEPEYTSKLPKGQILLCAGSDQPMILETRDIKDGLMETTGITLTQWLNNRIIRTSADHSVREWHITGYSPGEALMLIVQEMCVAGDYLSGVIPIGIPAAETALWAIPGLQVGGADPRPNVDITVPFGPVYDGLKPIADTYDVGMAIRFNNSAYDDYFIIGFDAYLGTDRTSDQSAVPTIRFSEEMDTFTNIRDLESITDYKNKVYTFAPGVDPSLMGQAGYAHTGTDDTTPGFGLRVAEVFVDNLDPAIFNTAPLVLDRLNQEAKIELAVRKAVQLVDGEIVQTGKINYGEHYFLGDIVEVEGNTGVLQQARITEYIRSQDKAGDRAYPTLAMID